MAPLRKPFQGVWNIVRFNWHFYLLVLMLGVILLALKMVIAPLILLVILAETLLVSYYIYDLSGLYKMAWAGQGIPDGVIVNIHAGFDETSVLLKSRFSGAQLLVYDFYDPRKHTEISIKRARQAYPAFAGTRSIDTAAVPLQDAEADRIFVILAAHEIRDPAERTVFFSELKRGLKDNGRIFVTEHFRDLPNFLAYNIGFFHFIPRRLWYKAFAGAGLVVAGEVRINPFVRTFILEKYGTSA
jgi:hypothetical protein